MYGCACGCVGVLVIVMAFTSHNGGVMCCFMCNNFDTRAGATRLAATLATFDNKDHCDHIADARLLNTEGGRQELAKVATKRVATYSPDSGDTVVRVCTQTHDAEVVHVCARGKRAAFLSAPGVVRLAEGKVRCQARRCGRTANFCNHVQAERRSGPWQQLTAVAPAPDDYSPVREHAARFPFERPDCFPDLSNLTELRPDATVSAVTSQPAMVGGVCMSAGACACV